ncbi:GAF domain-containing protein [Natrinema sp. CBA1119]|uniref:GAF domain-containing protein n=1 Tax=Natrinema sp. CBA1119 TaxID=1608465 RepID=UPI001145FBB7|nr:GAF domain-containing protein [Natrinema sp. CBA1119]
MSNGSQSERAEQLRALHETTREMMAGETREAVADIAICAASDILGFSANAIHFYEDERGLVPVAATDRTREIIGDVPVFAEGESIAWRVYRTGEAAIVEDVHADPDVYNPQTPIRSEIHLPIGTHGIFIAGSEPRASSMRPNSRWDRCSPQTSNRRSSKSNASRSCCDRTSVSRSSPASCHTISAIR